MARIEFRKVRQFVTAPLALLSKQLDTLEANIDAAFKDADAAKLNALIALPRFTAANAKPITAGQCAQFDTSAASITVTLERPTRELAAQCALLIKRSSLNTLTLRVAPPAPNGTQGKINGAGSVAYGAGIVGLLWVFCDGVDWWSPP